MSKGTGRRRRSGLVAAAIGIAALSGATSAQAVTANLIGEANNSHAYVSIGGWADGEQNDITVQPSGAVRSDGATGSPSPLVPRSVVVTDKTTPLQAGVGACVPLSAHSVRCTTPVGIDAVEASLGNGGSGSSFELVPGATGYLTPMRYELNLREGNDRVTIPTTIGITGIWSLDGNDTIVVNDSAGAGGDRINAGPGDDDVRLTSTGPGFVNCGDGVDTALIVANPGVPTDCESVTP